MADNITQQLEQNGALPSAEPMIPSSGRFDYQPVADLLLPPNTPEFTELMTPEYKAMLERHASQINSFAPAAIGNLNDPNPTLATDTLNPFRQKVGLDLSTPEGKMQLFRNAGMSAKPTGEVKIADPLYAGIRSHNFDRYYKHAEFSNLGWHPYANNEETYNANSSWWDDAGRMMGQFTGLAGTGFVSAYRSIGDLFDDDDYFTGTDLTSASEFADAMRIGNSTRGGFGGGLNNLLLQSGYTMGVIGSIAVEELALWGAAAAQGGLNPVSDAAAVSRTGWNIARLGKTIANTFDLSRLTNATRNMYRGLRSVDSAKDVYTGFKAGGRFLADVIAPETAQAIRSLTSTANGAQNLSNMAKVAKTFGGFYRDLRSLNLALAESKMEGGMVYQQQLANGYALKTQMNNGQPLDEAQMNDVVEKASRAAYYTTLLNAPTIYLSNQLVLGNAFGAYNRTLSRVLQDNVEGLGRRVIKTQGTRVAGKMATRPFADAGTGVVGYLNRMKAAGVTGSAKMAAQASLRYFSANLSEGLQEVAQEAIAVGTKGYHQALLEDPASGGRDLLMGTISSAVGSQFSAQGFETFMSGFMMGGIVQGPQKLFFQGVPTLYQKTFEKTKYEEYRKNKQEFIDGLVKSMNDTYEVTANNPMESIFDTNKTNLVTQKQASVDMMQAAFDQSNFDFVDAKDFSKFQAIYTVLANDKGGEFKSQFEDYLKMTDQELAEAFPTAKSEVKSGKLRQRMQDMISKIDELEESYYVNKSKFNNPFDASIYKFGSREWNEEKIKQMSFEHARYLYMFTEDGFKRAVERSQKIYDELAADPIVGKMAASDITVLLDENSLQKEIATLLAEIGTLDAKENKDLIDSKTAKLEGLNGILSVLYAEENITKDGAFDRRKVGKLRGAFEKYVQKLAKSNDSFSDPDKVSEALKKIVDYRELKGRAIAYNKSIEYMNNPERFDEIRKRSYDFMKNIYKNRAEVFRKSVKSYVGKIEINQFLNELAKLEVYPDPKEVAEFMSNGDVEVLKTFFTENGVVNQVSDEDIYNEIQALINIYKSAVTPQATEQTAEEKIDSKEKQTRKKDTADILSEADLAEDTPEVEIFGTKENDNPVIKEVLEEKYKEYVNRQANLGQVPVQMDTWVNSAEAAKYITSYEALKKLWYKELQKTGEKAEAITGKFNSDTGFKDWLQKQQTNDLVRKVLKSTETNFSDFVEIEQDFEAGDVEDADIGDVKAVGKVIDNTFNSVQIVETKTSIVDPETGMPVPVTLYSVRDKKGKLLTEDKTSAAGVSAGATFDNINKARSAAKKLDDVSVDTTSFPFGGMQVSYGATVTDKEGNRYMVIGTPAEVEKGKKLFLLPVDEIKPGQSKQDRNKLSKKVTEVEFKNDFTVDSFNFSRVPKDASRLLINEAIEVYPLENGMGTAATEGILMANARLQTILENLSPEEKATLTLVIKRNPNGGKSTGKKYQTRDEEGNFKEANPYINRVSEPFAVGIAFGNQVTASRINQIISEKGMVPSSHPDGIFAFVRTGSIQFLNDKNQVVNPLNLTKEIIENTFTIYPSQQANAVNTVVNNFAIQQAFVDQVADKMEGQDSAIIPMTEFSEFGFNLGSSVDLKSNPKSVKELKYNTVDGVRVLLINDRLKDGTISTRILADIEDIDEREAFVEKLKGDLAISQPGLFESLQKSQRYVAIIKTPNGIYTGAPLKSERLDQNAISELGKELVAEGIRTINANLEGDGSIETKTIKDKNFNVEFNKAFNKKLYITTNIEGYTVEINVNSDGTFRAELYDKKGKALIGSSYLAEGRQGTLDYEGQENPDIIERLLDNLQKKGIEAKIKDIEAQKKKGAKVEIPEWTKLKLSVNNVRASFEEDATIDTILDSTVTSLNENVRTNYKLRLNADANVIAEAMLFASTSTANTFENFVNTGVVPEDVLYDIANKIKNNQTLTTEEQAIFTGKTSRINQILVELKNETAEEAYDSVLDMSDEVFEEYAKADFKELPLEMKQQVANKIARGEKLSTREERMVKNAVSGPTIQLLAGKAQRDNKVDATAQSLKTELQQNKARIKEIEAEIDNAEPNMVKANELIEDNEERAKLIARNREIERKLLANKIISEELTDTEVADIDEFVLWANDNLPDFISIEDINNLRDNLVTNGVRVGAFVLSMNNIAGGMKVKGTLYTGAKSPYKFHEAFHGVFRSLLTNAQQDKLYKIAEAEVKRKLGNKFEEELEKFRNSADSYKAMSRKALEKEFYEEYMADEFEKFKKDPRSTKTDSAIKNFFNRIIEWIKSLFNRYSPNELQDLFRNIDSGKFKSASPINNRFTDSLATGVTLNANKIIPVELVEGEGGQFGYRTLDNDFARSIVSSISARVIMLEQENKNAKFNLKQAVNQSFALFKSLYSTKREAYNYMSLTADQKGNLREIEKAFTDFSDFIKDAVYDELKYYEIKSRNIEEDNDAMDDEVGDRLRTTDQYDKDLTSIGGFSSLSSFLRKYIGTTPITEKDEFGNDYLIEPQRDEKGEIVPGTGEKLMITVDFATAYNGFLKAVKNLNDPIQILQQLYFFGINNPQTEAVVNKLFADLGIQWEGQLENGELPQYTSEVIEKFKAGEIITAEELNQGVKRPLLLQAVLKGFENARVDYLFIHRSSGDKVYTYTAANRDDAHTQVDRWGQAYIQKAKTLRTNEGVRTVVVNTLDKLLNRLQFVAGEGTTSQKALKTLTDTKLKEFAEQTARILEENVGISISPKFIEFSVAKNIEKPTRYQKALLNANSDERPLSYQDVVELKKIIEANQDLYSDSEEGAKNRLRRIALGNAAFDENVGSSVFKNPNGDLVYAHQLPSFHLKQIQSLNDVAGEGAKIDEVRNSDEYLLNNFLLNSEAFKQLSAEGRLRILRIAGSKVGNIDLDENGLMSETSGASPSSGKTYGDSTPREFIINLINAYTYAIDPLTGKVASVSWTKEDGTIELAAIAPVLLRVLEASNTGDMIALPVVKAVMKNNAGKTVLTENAINSIVNNVAAEFARIQKESNPETATQELHVGYNALAIPNSETGTEEIIPINVDSTNVNKARAFNFHKTGVLLNPLGQKKESRQGIVTIQTSDIKLERIQKGEQTAVVYDQKAAEQFIGFTSVGVVRDAIIKTKDGEKNVPMKIVGRGLVRVTPENRERIFEDLKGSISLIKNDQFKYEVRLGTKKFYVESINEQQFLQGRKPMYMYELIDAELADFEEQTAALIGGFDQQGYLDKLTEAARSPEYAGLTFTEALTKLGIKEGELKAFLENRLNQEFNEFNIALDELIGTQGGLGTFLSNGIQTGNEAVTADTIKTGRLLNILPEDKDYNLRQIFFNDYINTTAINQILLGDSAYSLKDAVDEIKRAKAQSASYYSAASSIAAPEYGIYKPLQEFSIFEMTEPSVNATHNQGEIKNADAQLWMTTKAFRNFQYGFGKLSPAQAQLFDRVERGEDITAEDIFGTEEESGYAKRQEMLNSQKLVYADGKTFVKMSAFPLLPQFTSIKDENGEYTIPKPNKVALHNLRVKLEAFERENDTVAVAAPRSALKMMQKNVSNIHGVTGTTAPLTKQQSVTLDANFLGLQVINPSNKTVITDPTQVKSLVTSEQNDATEVVINGEKLTLGEVRAAYHKATRDRGNLNYINKRNLVFSFDIDYAMDELHKSVKENAITADLYTYLRYAEASLASNGSSSHLMELFSLDESGNQKYNLNNPLTYDKFLNLFMSYFSKSVFNEKVPGATISLVSDYGVRIYRRVLSVDENGMPDKHEIITEAQYEAMASKPQILFNIDEGSYPGNDENLTGLKDAVKKSKGAGVVIIDRLRHNMKEYNSKGKATGEKYGEMLLPPHHKEVMSELQQKGKSIPDVVGKMFAVRIPSQDNHSTYNVKWVDFMPAVYGSSGVFARELIEISGADFDIDKVYTQFKEFFEKGGEFFEYGKAKTEKEQFEDYVQYVNKKVQDTDSIYGEALYKFKGRGTTNSLTAEQTLGARSQGFTEDAINALSVLGMPRFYAEYSTYRKKFGHEPYAAAINNDILDYKFALMGNDNVTERKPLFLDKNGNTTTVNTGKPALDENGKQKTAVPISYEAADMEVLKDLWDELKTELPEWAALSEEEGIDVDNLYGKLRMFANNKEGSRSIGAVVLPNLYLNLLQEYDVKIESIKIAGEEVMPQIKFGGLTFSSFKNTYELYENGSQGQRTQYILSALITAATDNAKERLLAKLGLNINALSVVANLVALGVPVKTGVLLINHPVIRQAYFEETNSPEDEPVTAANIIRDRIALLQSSFLETEERGKRTSVTQNALMQSIEAPLIKPTATAEDMANLRESGEVDKIDIIEEISILEQFLNAANLSNTTRYMGDLLNLTNGLGQGLEAIDKRNAAVEKLGLNLSNKDYAALGVDKPMIDARPIFKGNTWQAGYLERFEEFTNNLLPKVVLSASPLFRRVTDEIVYQSTINSLPYELRDRAKTKVAKDFLSYLTIKAYMHNGMVNNSQSVATLTNGLIYNQEGVENITKVVDRLRSIEDNKNNYFLNSFIIAEKASLKGNKTGLNLASANTFLRYNDSQKLDIQNGFMTLFANPLTREDARTLVNYMMVKDGLQYGYKSLVEAVAPIALDNYLSHIDTVQAAMERTDDAIFKSTFGVTLDDLVIQFMQGYLTSAANAYVIKRVKAAIYAPETKGILVEPKVYTKNLAAANPEAIYVFGDNVAKQGSVGNSSVRGLENAFGLFFKKDLNRTESSYYTNAEAGDFITIFDEQVEQLTNMIAEGKQVIFPKDLITTPELADFKKNSPAVFEYVKAKLKQDLNYNIDPKAKLTAEEKKEKRVADPAILRAPVHVNASGLVPRLVVDLYAGITKVERNEAVSAVRNTPAGSKLTKQLADTFSRNKKALRKAGFRNLINLKKGSDYHTEVEFPMVIRQNVGSDYKAEYKYYILTKTQSLFPKGNLINFNNKAVGSYAEYVEVDIKGSTSQNPIGFMFGERPTTKELRNFVNSVNSNDPFDVNFDSIDLDAALDAIDLAPGIALSANAVVVANEKGIQVDGENISKLDPASQEVETKDLVEPEVEPTGNEDLFDEGKSIDISANSFFSTLLADNDAAENKYPELTTWWDTNVDDPFSQQALDNRNKLKAHRDNADMKFKVTDLDDFIQMFEDSEFTNEQEFLDHFNNCYL